MTMSLNQDLNKNNSQFKFKLNSTYHANNDLKDANNSLENKIKALDSITKKKNGISEKIIINRCSAVSQHEISKQNP